MGQCLYLGPHHSLSREHEILRDRYRLAALRQELTPRLQRLAPPMGLSLQAQHRLVAPEALLGDDPFGRTLEWDLTETKRYAS